MLIVHSPNSPLHNPDRYFRRGEHVQHPEQAERYHLLLRAALAGGHIAELAGDHGMAPLAAVHTADHIAFLSSAWGRRDEWPTPGDEILTGHFARPQMSRRPDGLLGLVGYHTADTSTPIRAGTWNAVYGSAQAAISGAEAARAHGHAYALCRPPGHHAYVDSAGGFCFLNNTAIAAQHLRTAMNGPVAILDIDVHHGNGTQGIFYQRADVLTVSIHGDPTNHFPYYVGYADETGAGAGAGYNLNLPLAYGTGDAGFVRAVEDALTRIEAFGAVALVVALGLDASEHDPIGVLKVTGDGFAATGRLIAEAGLPTVLVQEGGYLCDALPVNLQRFLGSFDEGRRT